MLDVRYIGARTDRDEIGHAEDAGQLANGLFSGLLVKIPFDVAAQGDPAVLHLQPDLVVGDGGIPGDDLQGPFGNLVVGRLLVAGKPHLDLLSDRAHAFDPPHDLLGDCPLGVALRHGLSR